MREASSGEGFAVARKEGNSIKIRRKKKMEINKDMLILELFLLLLLQLLHLLVILYSLLRLLVLNDATRQSPERKG